MTKIITGDIVLKEDTVFKEDLIVEGNIRCEGGLWDLKCKNLECWDLKCWNLECLDLKCKNLDFYAIAIAYRSFKCKSWKAERKNYIIKCLDGEVEVENESTTNH